MKRAVRGGLGEVLGSSRGFQEVFRRSSGGLQEVFGGSSGGLQGGANRPMEPMSPWKTHESHGIRPLEEKNVVRGERYCLQQVHGM